MPAALLSRFDMVFLLLDTVDCDKDFSREFFGVFAFKVARRGDNKLGCLHAKSVGLVP